jgi:hypothetical protein
MFDLIIQLHLHAVLPEVQMDEVWVPSERNAVSEISKHENESTSALSLNYLYCCTVHFEDSLSTAHQQMH